MLYVFVTAISGQEIRIYGAEQTSTVLPGTFQARSCPGGGNAPEEQPSRWVPREASGSRD